MKLNFFLLHVHSQIGILELQLAGIFVTSKSVVLFSLVRLRLYVFCCQSGCFPALLVTSLQTFCCNLIYLRNVLFYVWVRRRQQSFPKFSSMIVAATDLNDQWRCMHWLYCRETMCFSEEIPQNCVCFILFYLNNFAYCKNWFWEFFNLHWVLAAVDTLWFYLFFRLSPPLGPSFCTAPSLYQSPLATVPQRAEISMG